MERYEFYDPAIAYERTEGKIRYAARQLMKIRKEDREAIVKLCIPEHYQQWVLKAVSQMEDNN